jgi:lipid-binding SYLF domain-containing protein
MKAVFAIVTISAVLAASSAWADISTGERNRLNAAMNVITEFRGTPDRGIPQQLWQKAQCVMVLPSVKKAAFVIGGSYGKGVMSCRTANGWSAPVFMEMAKGSWGLQIGAEEADLVLLVMNKRGVDKMLQDKATLGADASVAAGPVGRAGEASTDLQAKAEILSYSKANGLFAGIDLSGGVLRPDKDANQDVYGTASPSDVIAGIVKAPESVTAWSTTLSRDVAATTGQTVPSKTDQRHEAPVVKVPSVPAEPNEQK